MKSPIVLLTFGLLIQFSTFAQNSTQKQPAFLGKFIPGKSLAAFEDSLVQLYKSDADSVKDLNKKEYFFTGINDSSPFLINGIEFNNLLFEADTNRIIHSVNFSKIYSNSVQEKATRKARKAAVVLINYLNNEIAKLAGKKMKPERRLYKHKIDMIEYIWTLDDYTLLIKRVINKRNSGVSIVYKLNEE